MPHQSTLTHHRICPKCGHDSFDVVCEFCGRRTVDLIAEQKEYTEWREQHEKVTPKTPPKREKVKAQTIANPYDYWKDVPVNLKCACGWVGTDLDVKLIRGNCGYTWVCPECKEER